MLTNKDKAFLKSVNWRYKDIELLEKELKANKVRMPYFIRSLNGFIPLAEVKEYVKGEQCLKRIYKNIFNEDVEVTYKRGKVQKVKKMKPLKTKGKLPFTHGVGKKI